MSGPLDPTTWTQILDNIKNITEFDEQINYLENSFQNNSFNISDLIKTIQNDLTLALSQTFPQHKIHFYGSAMLNLNVGPPVLDIYIENILEHVKYELDVIITIKSLLAKSKNFNNVIIDSQSNFTFLKWKHKNTLDCILKVYPSKVWVTTSELIHCYLKLDKKLHQMFLLFKSLGRFDSEWKNFPSIAIYWLVIFYLQQEPYCLPSVYQIEEKKADNLNCTFNFRNIKCEALTSVTVKDLFVGFLEFYSNFDYVRYVISPYCGSVIEKICYVKPYDLPDCYINFMKTGKNLNVGQAYCIQDPLQHSQNLVADVAIIVSGNFRKLCQDAVQIIKQTEKPNLHNFYLFPPNSKCNFCLKKESKNLTNQEWFDIVKKNSLKILDFLICHKILELFMQTSSATFDCLGRNLIFEDKQNILKGFLPKVSEDLEGGISVVLNAKKKPRNRDRPWTFRVSLVFNENECEADFTFEALKGFKDNATHAFYFFQTCLIRHVEIETKKTENNPDMESEICMNIVHEKMNENKINNLQSSVQNVSENVDNCLDNLSENLDGTNIKMALEEKSGKDEDNQKNEKQLDESEEKQTEDIEEGEISEDEEEDDDVPADFFDDFSKEDFLSGLDIVDTWYKSGEPKKTHHHKSKDESKIKIKIKTCSRSKSKGLKRCKRKSKERSVSRHRSKERRERSKELSSCRQRSTEGISSRHRSKERISSRHNKSKERSNSRQKSKERNSVRQKSKEPSPSRQRSKERNSATHKSKEASPSRQKNKERNSARHKTKEPSPSRHRSKERSTSKSRSKERYHSKIKPPRGRHTISKSKSRSRSPRIRRRRSISRSRSRSRSRDRKNNRKKRSYSNSSVSSYEKYKDRRRSRSQTKRLKRDVNKEALMEEVCAKLNGIITTKTADPPPLPVPPPPQISIKASPSTVVWNPAIQKEKTQISSREIEEERRQCLAKKLFMEKRISLSDYLSIIAKRKGAVKQHHQKKLEVISLCQNILKVMGFFSEPLKVIPRSDPDNTPSQKFSSPLQKNHPEINFTSLSQQKNRGFFTCTLREILERVGLLGKEKDIHKLISSVADVLLSGKSITKETATNILKISLMDPSEKCYTPTTPTSHVATQCKEKENIGVQATRPFREPSGTRWSLR